MGKLLEALSDLIERLTPKPAPQPVPIRVKDDRRR